MGEWNKIICGDSLEKLKELPDGVADCCITSPPYYGLRDYGTGKWIGGDPKCPHRRLSKRSDKTITGHKQAELEGNVGDAIYKSVCPLCGAVREDKQIGLEDTPEQYIDKLVELFREVRRVLKDDGTLWINIGDSYNGQKKGNTETNKHKGVVTDSFEKKVWDGAKTKDLIGIPWMLAFALREDGWYLRQDIIWCLSGGTYLYVKSKKGVMPMTIKDMIRLKPSDVKLWNGEKWVNVIGWGKSNDTSCKLEIVLRSGERIQCTGGHKWVLADGTEKKASELVIGDVLATTEFCDEGYHTPSVLTKDVLWLIGLYIAEGSRSGDCIQIALHAKEMDWVERIRLAVASVGGTVTYTLSGNCLDVRIYSQVFDAILHQYVGGHIAKNKHLNNICWQMPNDNLREIVNGYLDGDGYYDAENDRWRIGFTRNYYFERDLRLLANRLKAVITLKISHSYIGEKKYPTFRGEWRWNTSEHFNCKDRSEIIEIKNGSGRNYYDISVDCDNHLFALASGVLTHNCKPNPMPESVKDRCTKSHEYIFLLSKNPQYYFDYEAIQEEATGYDGRKDTMLKGSQKYANSDYMPNQSEQTMAARGHERWKFKNLAEKGQMPHTMHERRAEGKADILYPVRNKRDVWTVCTKPNKEAHFATFPEELITPCILAGCRKGGVVLDPFFGSGTTGRVAREYGRDYIGIELNPEYVKIAERRAVEVQLSIFGMEDAYV